jgi:hypothetical protein
MDFLVKRTILSVIGRELGLLNAYPITISVLLPVRGPVMKRVLLRYEDVRTRRVALVLLS